MNHVVTFLESPTYFTLDQQPSWKEAHTRAVVLARELRRDVGLWKAEESGKVVWNIRSLPRPENRYGHELRCEVITPSDPI